jgi:triacylglycerol lipase
MAWWNFGNNRALSSQQFLNNYTRGKELTDLNPFQGGVQVNPLALNAFEQIESNDEKLLALKGLNPASRKALLQSIDAVSRDQLLGGTAFDAAHHHTGPAFSFDWKQFDSNNKEYSPKNAHALSIAAKRAYESPADIRKEFEAQGFEVKTFDRNGTQAFLAVKDDVSILSFRGTEPDAVEDLLTDAQICQVERHGGKVHEGFDKGLDAVWPEIQAEMERTGAGKDKPLYVTGHSLGAALGTLAAARIEEQPGMEVNGLYTFGSPRVGDGEFAEKFNDSALGQKTWRFRNNSDGVTLIPPPSFSCDYTHVGTEIYFDNEGKAHNNPTEHFVHRDKSEAFLSPVQSYFLKKHARDKAHHNNPAEHLETMWDHSITGYAKHLFVNQDFEATTATRFKR